MHRFQIFFRVSEYHSHKSLWTLLEKIRGISTHFWLCVLDFILHVSLRLFHCLLSMLLLASLLLPNLLAKIKQAYLAESNHFLSRITCMSLYLVSQYSWLFWELISGYLSARFSRLFQGHFTESHFQGAHGTPVTCTSLGGNGCAYKCDQASNVECTLRMVNG